MPTAHKLALVVIAAAATLPFLNKAFHIDDVLYLRVAEQILQTPWDPYGKTADVQILWDAVDGKPAGLYETDFNPPLWKYALAGMIAVVGMEEWKLHLLPMVFVFLATWGIYRVSARITQRPLWCVVMIILSPFFLPGQNLMLEVPVLCFVAWGMEFHLRSCESGRARDSIMAGVFVGLAILTKYTYVLLVPLFLLAHFRKRPTQTVWFLTPVLILVGLWCSHNYFFYGELHLTSHGATFQQKDWPLRILTIFRIVGAVAFLGPVWWVNLYRRGLVGRVLLLGIVVVAIFLGWIDLNQARQWYIDHGVKLTKGLEPLFAIFTALGAATIFSMIAVTWIEAIRHCRGWLDASIDRQLEICVAVLFLFNVMNVPFNAVRHLLLMFLALVWLTARLLDRIVLPRWPMAMAATSVALAFLLAWGDYESAHAYRRLASTKLRQDIQNYSRVWFSGTWGFKFYAEREGAVPYFAGIAKSAHGIPIVGDRIYHPELLNWSPVMESLPSAKIVDFLFLPNPAPIRTLLPGVSYYGVGNQHLPWGSLFVLTTRRWPPLEVAPSDVVPIYEMQ